MASNADWALGYMAQAREDLRAVETLCAASAEVRADASVICMILQMVLE
ncbi:MAG: hypothetical protein AB1714_26800 [Acidobacteriota bacterium]